MKILQTPIFHGINEEEFVDIEKMNCVRRRSYGKNSIVFHAGDIIKEMGVVRSGSVNIENTDLWGNKSILSNVGAGHVFAESYALCGTSIMVDVVAAEDCDIFFLNLSRIISEENKAKSWYHRMLLNLTEITAHKNLVLSTRIFCTSPKGIRSRLLTYLTYQAVSSNSRQFRIPFNRQQLSEYLNVDRSALSKELCRMRDEGMLEFNKNEFRLLITEE